MKSLAKRIAINFAIAASMGAAFVWAGFAIHVPSLLLAVFTILVIDLLDGPSR